MKQEEAVKFTPGMARAIQGQKNDKAKCACKKCQYQLPTYPGSYPKDCPMCGHALGESVIEDTDRLIDLVLEGIDPEHALDQILPDPFDEEI